MNRRDAEDAETERDRRAIRLALSLSLCVLRASAVRIRSQ